MRGNAGPGVTHQPGRLPTVSGRAARRRRVSARLEVAAGIVALLGDRLPAPIVLGASNRGTSHGPDIRAAFNSTMPVEDVVREH
jgi:hypothetical protein